MINFHNFFIWIEIYVYCLESKSLIALYDCVCVSLFLYLGFPGGSDNKASAHNARDPGSIPRSGRSPEEWNGNPLQYPCLENSMDGGAWWAIVHGIAKSWTQLSDFTLFLTLFCSIGLLSVSYASTIVFWLLSLLYRSLFPSSLREMYINLPL